MVIYLKSTFCLLAYLFLHWLLHDKDLKIKVSLQRAGKFECIETFCCDLIARMLLASNWELAWNAVKILTDKKNSWIDNLDMIMDYGVYPFFLSVLQVPSEFLQGDHSTWTSVDDIPAKNAGRFHCLLLGPHSDHNNNVNWRMYAIWNRSRSVHNTGSCYPGLGCFCQVHLAWGLRLTWGLGCFGRYKLYKPALVWVASPGILHSSYFV